MSFLDLLLELIGVVDFAQCEIVHPSSLVFLCGGQAEEARQNPSSMREALLRSLPDRRKLAQFDILLAELALKALPNTEFDNLLDLEECIAALVDAVILIVESPGSICELGAFVKTPEISKKLVVLIQNAYANAQSFITLGPIKYLQSHDPNSSILPFHWGSDGGEVQFESYIIEGMIADIPDAVKNMHRTETFNANELGHRIYLTLALCHLLRGAKIGELKSCFEAMGLHHAEREIKKYLNTLEICGFVRTVANGAKRVHFVPLTERLPMNLAFRPGTTDRDRNTLRWLTRLLKVIKADDPTRIKIFQAHNAAA